MSEITDRLNAFRKYHGTLRGDEKGEAQVFCDRLFQAFGHAGYKEAGAELESRIRRGSNKGVVFADLIWKPRMLLEMKKRGTNLLHHYEQAFDYWIHSVPNRPRYVVLCNFDEFWIYDFDKQIDSPVDVVSIEDLPRRYNAMGFLFQNNQAPVFGNDLEAVSRKAADQVARLFSSCISRGESREKAQRFVLQLVVAMFAEDIDLLPANVVYGIVEDCLRNNQSSYDLFAGLFRQMNSKSEAKAGRFKDIPYFNGGIFQTIEPIELTRDELELIGGDGGASRQDWSKVNPAIFGTIFQQSMDASDRHAYGAHFTSEAAIMRIVKPTIVRPWLDRIEEASGMRDLISLRKELLNFKVLDPACGSGNFLYVSYRELVRVEIALMAKLKETVSKKVFERHSKSFSVISPLQFFGIDRDHFGSELAKITLMLAKKLALDEVIQAFEDEKFQLPLEESALPLDNLDSNIICEDALFSEWPKVDAIVGNPPFQSKNKIQRELGRAYVNRVREQFPDVPGRADYCVYWFRKAHDELGPNQRAGLVGTNTVRQNYSRVGSLDHIVENGGVITEAVSSMKWPGDAAVHVSIVNWMKGAAKGKKRLWKQKGSDPSEGWGYSDHSVINSALSDETDVTKAKVIEKNAEAVGCYQGQTHGHKGFLLPRKDAEKLLGGNPEFGEVLFPYLIADELTGSVDSLPKRYVIDFQSRDRVDAAEYPLLFKRAKDLVLPDRERAAAEERERNQRAREKDPKARVNHHHRNFLNRWWQLSWTRGDMISSINSVSRYIAGGRVTSSPIYEFVNSGIHPNDALVIFPFEDDYSFGILQSDLHWQWFRHRCSTLGVAPRYTSNTVFDTFPWPQNPSVQSVLQVAQAAVDLRRIRNELKSKKSLSFREMYCLLEEPGDSPIKDAHGKLNQAVRKVYGMQKSEDPLAFLLKLNHEVAAAEKDDQRIWGPGLPDEIKADYPLVTDDCVCM